MKQVALMVTFEVPDGTPVWDIESVIVNAVTQIYDAAVPSDDQGNERRVPTSNVRDSYHWS